MIARKFFVYPFASAGDVAAIPNAVQPSGSVSYASGWGPFYALQLGVDPNALPIPRPQMNQLFLDITTGMQQYQVWGIPNYITSSDNLGTPFSYPKWAYCLYDDGGGNGPLPYQNTVAANVNVPSIAGVTQPGWALISGSDIPAGTVIDYASTTPPAGYLACDGSAISRTVYSNLFTAIGTLWGTGDGVTTFNLPDLRRRTTIGSGGTGSSVIGNAVSNTGGEEAHTQTVNEMPNHNHPGSTTTPNSNYRGCASGSGVSAVSDAGGAINLTIAPQGGGNPFNVMQPSAVMQKCIKF